MAIFVVLNFEDQNPGAKIKPEISRDPKKLPGSVHGSAQATVAGVITKARKKEVKAGKNFVHHYSGVELIQADVAGTLTRDDVNAVRKDCSKADKIYIIMHGSPDDTDQGFANGGKPVATWAQLARLSLMLFPVRDTVYRVSLIMCYGARVANYRLNNLGMLAPGDLKTSFAYKFFRSICIARNVSMTACTGAVSTGDNGVNAVETEEWVAATLDVIDYKKDTGTRQALQAQLAQTKQAYITGGNSAADWDALVNRFLRSANEVANDATEQVVKAYCYEKAHRNVSLQAAKSLAAQQHQGLANREKYGRIRYTYDGAQLQIVNKYGDPLNPAVGQDYLLYTGPLL
jgi:hypothetical protein